MTPQQISELINAKLPDARVEVSSDDNTHFEALVVAPDFEGQRVLRRHQMIYAALGDLMGGEIHALSIQALTPDEWAAEQP